MRTLIILVFLFSNIFSKDFEIYFNDANNYYNNSKYLESIKLSSPLYKEE